LDEKKTVPQRGLYEWTRDIVTALLAIVCLLTFVGRNIEVQGISMEPTLAHGDQMIVRSIFYTPQRGDIIVLSKQYVHDGHALVKRVIALAGDVVDINPAMGLVYVNGEALYEPYTKDPTYFMGDVIYPFTVPPGQIFVLGDNRNDSLDSRSSRHGPVDVREIIGQVVAVIFPLDRAGFFF